MIDFGSFDFVTFDCYGTLVDWEAGILASLKPILDRHGAKATDARLLRIFSKQEREQESKEYQPYRSVLRNVMAGIAAEVGFPPMDRDLDALPASVADWPVFEDTPDALARMKERYKLAILSNVDDDLFAATLPQLGVEMDEVVTAQQVQSYKPAHAHFKQAMARLGATPPQILHVAQSLYHDHVPAKQLGFTTVWVNRASRRPGRGLAPKADAQPDIEVPDLASLAELMAL